MESDPLSSEAMYEKHKDAVEAQHKSLKKKKKALSAMDDKTYLLADGINSLKWGHKDIPPEKNIPGSSNNAVC